MKISWLLGAADEDDVLSDRLSGASDDDVDKVFDENSRCCETPFDADVGTGTFVISTLSTTGEAIRWRPESDFPGFFRSIVNPAGMFGGEIPDWKPPNRLAIEFSVGSSEMVFFLPRLQLPGFRDPETEDVYLMISVSDGSFRFSKDAGLADFGGGVDVVLDFGEDDVWPRRLAIEAWAARAAMADGSLEAA